MIPKIKEKRKPHYILREFKVLFRSKENMHITKAAHHGAASEGYMTDEDIQSVIDRLCSEHFYKSMTSYSNPKIWQDVYRYQDERSTLYIKIQLSIDGEKAILIQLKRDEGSNE